MYGMRSCLIFSRTQSSYNKVSPIKIHNANFKQCYQIYYIYRLDLNFEKVHEHNMLQKCFTYFSSNESRFNNLRTQSRFNIF